MADLGPSVDPREKLADWLRQRDNPYFARALVNRYWKHFLGRGLVEPEDDMRVSNPPSNPELLDALADDFVRSRLRPQAPSSGLIATSRAYDRSSLPNATNERDRRNFARFYAKRLPAEVLLDALEPRDRRPRAVRRAARHRSARRSFPTTGSTRTSSTSSAAPSARASASASGRARRTSRRPCTCSIRPRLQGKLGHGTGRAAKWVGDRRPDAEKVDELYRVALSRPPTAEEREVCLAHLQKRRAEKKLRQGYEDLIWTLINSKEFLFIQ